MSQEVGELIFLVFANFAFITLFSYLFSAALFRRPRPLLRAILCSLAGYATVWLVLIGLTQVSRIAAHTVAELGLLVALIGLAVTALVSLMLWGTFVKQWTPEADEFSARFD